MACDEVDGELAVRIDSDSLSVAVVLEPQQRFAEPGEFCGVVRPLPVLERGS